MIITKERLMNVCQSFIIKEINQDKSISGAFLTGSMLSDDPFLNGSTDIDLYLVHNNKCVFKREIVQISPEITFDIYNVSYETFEHPRDLRLNPWLGSDICYRPILLYEKSHWFELMQSSVEANFFLPDLIIKRAHAYSYEARKIWNFLNENENINNGEYSHLYYEIIKNSVNSLFVLSGKPSSNRRIIYDLEEKTKKISFENICGEIYRLLIGDKDPEPYFQYYYNAWCYYIDYFGKSGLGNIYTEYNLARKDYFTKPVEYFWQKQLIISLWIMGKTWSDISYIMKSYENEFFISFGMITKTNIEFRIDRLKQLDYVLDLIDKYLDKWSLDHGIEDTTKIIL